MCTRLQVDETGSGELTLPQVTQVLESLNTLAPEANIELSEQHMKVCGGEGAGRVGEGALASAWPASRQARPLSSR